MIPGPLPQVTHGAYLVAFYRSSEPGKYLDAGVYSEQTPTFTHGTTYDQGCDRSEVLMSSTSRRSFQRALDELLRRIEADPALAWVKSTRTYSLQRKADAERPRELVARVVVGRHS